MRVTFRPHFFFSCVCLRQNNVYFCLGLHLYFYCMWDVPAPYNYLNPVILCRLALLHFVSACIAPFFFRRGWFDFDASKRHYFRDDVAKQRGLGKPLKYKGMQSGFPHLASAGGLLRVVAATLASR